jgi:hypothetical protein
MRIDLDKRGVKELLNSADVADGLRPFAASVESAARRDPNPEYSESIRVTEHRSQGRAGRVSLRIGATPAFGMAVEAKRGTLARALGEA